MELINYKATGTKQYECVCVCILGLVIWHAKHFFFKHYIIICGLFGSTIFFHIMW